MVAQGRGGYLLRVWGGAVAVAGLLGLSALGVLAAGRSGPRSPEPHAPPLPPPPVAAPPAVAKDTHFLGVVLNGGPVELVARVEGRLAALCCHVGERVAAGAVVATQEVDETRQALQVAEATLHEAAAEVARSTIELEEARERVERRRAVEQAGFSDEERRGAEYQARVAEARLAGAKARHRERQARLAQLRTQLQEAQLRAPFDAVVAERHVEAGALLTRGAPVVRLLSAGPSLVRFAVPEDVASALTPGAPIQARVDASGAVLPGRLRSVAPEVDAASGLVFVLATLEPVTAETVLAGAVVRVALVEPAPGAPR